jgi:hypothetical protein
MYQVRYAMRRFAPLVCPRWLRDNRVKGAVMSKTITLAIGVASVILIWLGHAFAQSDCAAIGDSTARLECYDRAAKAKPTVKPVAKPAAKPADSNTVSEGSWQMRRTKDNMTDKQSCVISPAGKPYVQVTAQDLYISYRGRGGVQAFRYRIDDGPPSELQLVSDINKQIGALQIKGSTFDRIVRANRLRVSALSVLSSMNEEDLPLDGLSRLHARLLKECP